MPLLHSLHYNQSQLYCVFVSRNIQLYNAIIILTGFFPLVSETSVKYATIHYLQRDFRRCFSTSKCYRFAYFPWKIQKKISAREGAPQPFPSPKRAMHAGRASGPRHGALPNHCQLVEIQIIATLCNKVIKQSDTNYHSISGSYE